MSHKNKSGFTLVELAISLSIIGLIVAATLKGGELIKSAELKSIVAEVDEYKAALGNFELMYEGMPGDITNATSYWSGVTTNGDGDLTIDSETSNEPFAALDQLALAELIDGSYSGAWGTGFVGVVPGVAGNVPETARNKAFLYIKCCSGTDYARTISYNNHITIFTPNSNILYRDGILTPIEAFTIDDKFDDGLPDSGFIGASGSYASPYAATGCYTGTGSTSAYESANASYKDLPGCQMQFAYDWD